jgi:hypothetical protein
MTSEDSIPDTQPIVPESEMQPQYIGDICNRCHRTVPNIDFDHERYILLIQFTHKTHRLVFCSVDCLKAYTEDMV